MQLPVTRRQIVRTGQAAAVSEFESVAATTGGKSNAKYLVGGRLGSEEKVG